jgi:leucyl-tRNA synthetase
MDFNHAEIEAKWKQYWVENKTYKVLNEYSKPKYYVLDMFPYPSGSGLHVGHPLGYVASDVLARSKRMQGFNVLHPMGYDSFGLPAEQYAVQTGVHPSKSTADNIATYRSQLDNIGFSFDWDREVQTSNPKYYKWTQWIFKSLYEHYYDIKEDKALPITNLIKSFEQHGSQSIETANSQETDFTASEWLAMKPIEKDNVLMNYRLAYRKTGYVNWCEELGTVLANDEIKDGVSERGGFPVERKAMKQWFLRITAYAPRLLSDLDNIEWSEALKTMQRNWIGRSEGAQMFFEIKDHDLQLEIFTTRPDTIFGATYMVIAPEHDLVSILTTQDQKADIDACIKKVNSKSERDRLAEVKDMNGAFTGSYCINPFNGREIPIWIGDYVLKDYGTGAIMAVPSDDERDATFAKNYNLEFIEVVDKTNYPGASLHDKLGIIVNSDFLNGLEVPAALKVMFEKIEALSIGKKRINFKLRDANYSRQRYWGEPIPIFYDKDGVSYAMKSEELPLLLPQLDDFKPDTDGQSPLAKVTDWVNFGEYTRETDTMPGTAGSSWYFLRYMDVDNDQDIASPEALNYWKEVDFYIGGAEHAVSHLMYSRFWHKFLYDLGKLPTIEPFKKLVNQGMIQGVIESIYLKKSLEGQSYFYSETTVNKTQEDEFASIPVHVDFVTDYGTLKSHLNKQGLEKFLEWRPDYKNVKFVIDGGTYSIEDFPEDGRLETKSEVGKMSKRYFNVVNPDDVILKYGADVFRMYEMFLGPIEQSKPWDTKGIEGVSKFLKKLWYLIHTDEKLNISDEKPNGEEYKILHTAIKKVSYDINLMSLNTSIAAFMVCVNELKRLNCNKREIIIELVKLLAPFAPFTCEELWSRLGNSGSVAHASFPIFDEQYLIEDEIVYPICVNGKKRGEMNFATKASKEEIEKVALENESIQKWLEGQAIKKVVVVPGKMINFVI